MDAIKGTMTEIYNDLSKSTSGNTIAEVSVCFWLFRHYECVNTIHIITVALHVTSYLH